MRGLGLVVVLVVGAVVVGGGGEGKGSLALPPVACATPLTNQPTPPKPNPNPKQIIRYIAYARKYVHPRLSREAAAVLQETYLRMRAEARLGALRCVALVVVCVCVGVAVCLVGWMVGWFGGVEGVDVRKRLASPTPSVHPQQPQTTGRSMPITTRQLESLIRLSQARAKAELREVVTKVRQEGDK